MTDKEAKEILEWELNNFKYTDNEFVEATKVAIKALSIVEIIEDTFKQDSNLMMDFNDWKELLDDLER